jgi:hypothetical protein
MLIWTYIEEGFSIEWWKWQLQQPWRIVLQLYLLLSSIVLYTSYPRRLAYLCGIIHCILLTASVAVTSIHDLTSKPISWATPEDRGSLIAIPVVIGLLLWLFHRFTFGLPSRTYYGIVTKAVTAGSQPE